jgi:ectoine hydroxylase
MSILRRLRDFKFFHWIYNLLHFRQLLHNRRAYRKYRIRRPLFSSISSRDFPDKESQAWLDRGSSRDLVTGHPAFQRFDPEIQKGLMEWSENGMLLWKHFMEDGTVEAVNREIDRLLERKKLRATRDHKLLFSHRHSLLIDAMEREERLTSLLAFILGKKVVPFQTINFLRGSEQKAHSDSIHMTTYPLGYLIAVWIALEDVNESNGPLFYYPGSQKMPYLLNSAFNEGESRFRLGKHDYRDYESALQGRVEREGYEKKIFLASKGDLMIWHANLVHGGSPVLDPSLTRKSMVIHYFAEDVIKYHEITERPSLMPH